jgi:hypothetical protein
MATHNCSVADPNGPCIFAPCPDDADATLRLTTGGTSHTFCVCAHHIEWLRDYLAEDPCLWFQLTLETSGRGVAAPDY